MRVLALSRYGPLGASSRVRTLLYIDSLAREGIDVDYMPLLGDDYVRDLYLGRTNWPRIAEAYMRRAGALMSARARRADVLWIEKELLPWAPAWLERLACAGRPTVVDYDDALFHSYDLHRSKIVRTLFGRKIDGVMRHADCVLAGNDYLADRARRAGARRVVLLPTVVDIDRYVPAPRTEPAGRPVRIGWIGTPGTVRYLNALSAVIAQVASRHAIEMRVIGATAELGDVPTVSVPWSEATEVDSIRACDIGVMPLPDSPWERGKCGYKLIQYMACGLPVVASPVGVNVKIVQPGFNGYLGSDERMWVDSLSRLASNPALRAQLGAAGRTMVESDFSLRANAPRLAEELRKAASQSKRWDES